MNKNLCLLFALLALTLCACGAPAQAPQVVSDRSVSTETTLEAPPEREPEETLEGYILSFSQEGFTVNRITVKEQDKFSIAVSQEGENIDPVNVRLLPDTVYEKKLVYDAKGSRVETESMSREELEMDRVVDMTGYMDRDTFVAERVTMNVLLF